MTAETEDQEGPIPNLCPQCDGFGYWFTADDERRTCEACGGDGLRPGAPGKSTQKKGSAMKLTVYQRRVLAVLARHDRMKDGALSGPDLAHCAPRATGRREWAKPVLDALVRKGLAEELGASSSGARCYGITEAGSSLIASTIGEDQDH